jgi:hypothetical protein
VVLVIARLAPHSRDELASVPGLRKWQAEALGEALMTALAGRKR